MSELRLPQSADELRKRLKQLHEERTKVKAERRQKEEGRRRPLTVDQRAEVFAKTDGHCHLCGGDMSQTSGGELDQERALEPDFVIDHIVPFVLSGKDSTDNLLGAHGLCNGCRWFYSPEEFQWILRMGIWARKQMEDGKTDMAGQMRTEFLANEDAVRKRRKLRNEESTHERPSA